MTDMQAYVVEIKKKLLQMIAWGSVMCTLVYIAGAGWRLPGLILGIATSMIYFLLMGYRIHKSADMSVNEGIAYMQIGWLIRLSFVVTMLLLSIKIPIFDFVSAVIGLFCIQVVMIANAGFIVAKSFFSSR